MVLLPFSSMSASSADCSSWYHLHPSFHCKGLEKPRHGNFSPFFPILLWFLPLIVWWQKRWSESHSICQVTEESQWWRATQAAAALDWCATPPREEGLDPPLFVEITQQQELVLELHLSTQSSSSSLDLSGLILCLNELNERRTWGLKSATQPSTLLDYWHPP